MSFGKGFTKIRFSKIRENPAGKSILARQKHFKPAPPLGTPVRKSYGREEGKDALEKLNGFLDEECPEQAYFLVRVWDGQQKAITYKELKAAIINGYMSAEVLEKWQKDYSAYVEKHLVPGWYKAMEEAGKNFTLAGGEFRYDPMWTGITDWVKEHSAEFVTNCVQEQREAISGLLANSFMNGESPDEMSRAVRPCIGLTAPQAAANQRYYNHVKSTLMKENPKMAEATAAKKALEKSTQYAAEQHRYRAQVIATTEMAHAYNEGHLQAAKMAQAQGLLGRVQKVWSTADDERVCPYCGGLEGTVVDLDDEFKATDGKRTNMVICPPAHPNCRCAFEVREVEPARQGGSASLGNQTNEKEVDIYNGYGILSVGDDNQPDNLPQKLTDSVERARIINEAINAPKPIYAEELRMWYMNVKQKPGFADVVLHGSPKSTEYEHRYILDTETLSYIISGRKDCAGCDIRLISCSTGAEVKTGICVAQELANILKVNVCAPLGKLTIHPNGSLTVFYNGKEVSEDKGFKLFKPK